MISEKTLSGGFSIPVLGMGTWCFGGRETHNPENDDEAQIDAIRAGIDMGLRLIDTAEYYAAGYAETLTGKAIQGYDRNRLFLTSKVWKTHLRHDDVLKAAEDSLKRLGTDYFDLYLYHQIDDAVPLEETISAMNELVRRGMTKHIGVSNFALPRLQKAIACSGVPIVMNQVQYSLTIREPETTGLLAFCQKNDIMLQAWRPVRGLTENEVTQSLCAKYGCTLHQLALAWLLNQKNVCTVTAMKTISHIPENIKSAGIRMDAADVEFLREQMPDRQVTGAVPLR